MNIIIVGGYGTFGGRLARLIAHHANLNIYIAGRSISRATLFCDTLPAGTNASALVFDRNASPADLHTVLTRIAPDILVDASGPFQVYGEQPYGLLEACLNAGVNYIDLSDGAQFTAGVAQFNALALRKGVFAISGVSTCPALTSAVVAHLSADGVEVHDVIAGIAPSPFAGVGENVIRAIASYAGKKIPLRRNHTSSHAYALTETMRATIAPAGELPLTNRHFSLVDVPDLTLMAQHYPHLNSIWVGAAPVPAIFHRALNGLAYLVKWRMLPSLASLSRLFYWVINHARWGEHRGGMFVTVKGALAGKPIQRTWHLIAQEDDGPNIPAIGAAALIQQHLDGKKISSGARSAIHALRLADYAAFFAKLAIQTGVREDATEPNPPNAPNPSQNSLFQDVLGTAFARLPHPIAQTHAQPFGRHSMSGLARITRGNRLLARLIAAVIGFPAQGDDVPVRVAFDVTAAGETWFRTFGKQTFKSVLSRGKNQSAHLLNERFGPFTFGLALVLDGDKLRYIVRRTHFCGVPLPFSRVLAPTTNTFEYVDAHGRFCFDVQITHPLAGLIVHYQGFLTPSSAD